MQMYGNKYYIFGGESSVGALGDMWTLELLGEKALWTKVEPYTKGPGRRTGHTATVVGKHMFIFGGDTAHLCLDDMWAYNFEKNTWEQISSVKISPPARYGHAAVAIGKNVLIFGGANRHVAPEDAVGKSATVFFDDMWLFNAEMREWIRITQQPDGPCRRYGHTLTAAHGSVYLYGGFMSEGLAATKMNDLWELNPASLKWKEIHHDGSVIPPKVYAHSAIAVGEEEILVYGGLSTAASSSILIYDIGRNIFRYGTPANSPPARLLHSAAVHPNSKDMVIFGGQSERNQQPLHDVWSLATDQVIQAPSKLQLLSVEVSRLFTLLTGLRIAMRPDCNEAFTDPELQHPRVEWDEAVNIACDAHSSLSTHINQVCGPVFQEIHAVKKEAREVLDRFAGSESHFDKVARRIVDLETGQDELQQATKALAEGLKAAAQDEQQHRIDLIQQFTNTHSRMAHLAEEIDKHFVAVEHATDDRFAQVQRATDERFHVLSEGTDLRFSALERVTDKRFAALEQMRKEADKLALSSEGRIKELEHVEKDLEGRLTVLGTLSRSNEQRIGMAESTLNDHRQTQDAVRNTVLQMGDQLKAWEGRITTNMDRLLSWDERLQAVFNTRDRVDAAIVELRTKTDITDSVVQKQGDGLARVQRALTGALSQVDSTVENMTREMDLKFNTTRAVIDTLATQETADKLQQQLSSAQTTLDSLSATASNTKAKLLELDQTLEKGFEQDGNAIVNLETRLNNLGQDLRMEVAAHVAAVTKKTDQETASINVQVGQCSALLKEMVAKMNMQDVRNEEFVTHTALAEHATSLRQNITATTDGALNRLLLASEANSHELQKQLTGMQEQMARNEQEHTTMLKQLLAMAEKRFEEKLRIQTEEFETALQRLQGQLSQQTSELQHHKKQVLEQEGTIGDLQRALRENQSELLRALDSRSEADKERLQQDIQSLRHAFDQQIRAIQQDMAQQHDKFATTVHDLRLHVTNAVDGLRGTVHQRLEEQQQQLDNHLTQQNDRVDAKVKMVSEMATKVSTELPVVKELVSAQIEAVRASVQEHTSACDTKLEKQHGMNAQVDAKFHQTDQAMRVKFAEMLAAQRQLDDRLQNHSELVTQQLQTTHERMSSELQRLQRQWTQDSQQKFERCSNMVEHLRQEMKEHSANHTVASPSSPRPFEDGASVPRNSMDELLKTVLRDTHASQERQERMAEQLVQLVQQLDKRVQKQETANADETISRLHSTFETAALGLIQKLDERFGNKQ